MESGIRGFVTDGGLETDLIFHHAVDLPHFAAFPLLDSSDGCALLERYFDDYAAIAAKAGAGLMLETPTWRANPDWGAKLGYSAADLARVNRASIELMHRLRDRHALPTTVVSGTIGPRGDGYRPEAGDDPQAYHTDQIRAFADAGADLVTAYTLTTVAEAQGIVAAARSLGIVVAISFTVETDGKLPDGTSLHAALDRVDADYFLVNCAHPTHVERGLEHPEPRIKGLRVNASTLSHAELDEAETLDDGDPAQLAVDHARLETLLPALSIVGGCCGTDARHVAALWQAR